MDFREILGIDGYKRPAEGYMSWQHLTFVTSLVVIMIICAVLLGKRNKNKSDAVKNKVMIVTAILIDAFEIFKIVVLSITNKNPMQFIYVLPLFLCSIQLITIPLAAFSKGRLKEASLDFVMIFGMLGAILGTYFAGQNYGCYPVISMDNVVSGITHSLAGFAALYIMVSNMGSMKKKNIPITVGILGGFGVAAYIANIFVDCNYMFLSRGDGTPYDIVYNLVNGDPVIYPICVMVMFVIYIGIFYGVYYGVTKKQTEKNSENLSSEIGDIAKCTN